MFTLGPRSPSKFYFLPFQWTEFGHPCYVCMYVWMCVCTSQFVFPYKSMFAVSPTSDNHSRIKADTNMLFTIQIYIHHMADKGRSECTEQW